MMLLHDPQDVPVERPASLLHTSLGAGLTERLAGKASDKNVVRRNPHDLIVRVVGDVAKRVYPPVVSVDPGSLGIDLRRVHTAAAHGRQRRVEPTDPCEQVDEGERRAGHRTTVRSRSDSRTDVAFNLPVRAAKDEKATTPQAVLKRPNIPFRLAHCLGLEPCA